VRPGEAAQLALDPGLLSLRRARDLRTARPVEVVLREILRPLGAVRERSRGTLEPGPPLLLHAELPLAGLLLHAPLLLERREPAAEHPDAPAALLDLQDLVHVFEQVAIV
jgi:hypothetical protein